MYDVLALKHGNLDGSFLIKEYLKKVEVSKPYDTNDFDKFARFTLVDRSPDEPFLESDHSKQNTQQGKEHSTMQMNLRYNGGRGSRDHEYPRHSELFIGFGGGHENRGADGNPRFEEFRPAMVVRGDSKEVRMGLNVGHTDLQDHDKPFVGPSVIDGRLKAQPWAKNQYKVFYKEKEGKLMPANFIIPKNPSMQTGYETYMQNFNNENKSLDPLSRIRYNETSNVAYTDTNQYFGEQTVTNPKRANILANEPMQLPIVTKHEQLLNTQKENKRVLNNIILAIKNDIEKVDNDQIRKESFVQENYTQKGPSKKDSNLKYVNGDITVPQTSDSINTNNSTKSPEFMNKLQNTHITQNMSTSNKNIIYSTPGENGNKSQITKLGISDQVKKPSLEHMIKGANITNPDDLKNIQKYIEYQVLFKDSNIARNGKTAAPSENISRQEYSHVNNNIFNEGHNSYLYSTKNKEYSGAHNQFDVTTTNNKFVDLKEYLDDNTISKKSLPNKKMQLHTSQAEFNNIF